MIEKYGTYLIFKNKNTNEIKRIPFKDSTQKELMKLGHEEEWIELPYDPEDTNEIKN